MIRTKWELRRVAGLQGYTVEWADAEQLLVSRGSTVYAAAPPTDGPRRLLDLSRSAWASRLSAARLVGRLLRHAYYNVIPLQDGSFFLSFGRTVAVWRSGRVVPVRGLMRPLRILRNACAVDPQGDVFFGEYFSNADRGPVHIYRLPLGDDRVEVAHRFDAGAVRHVHGIHADPFEGGLWCLTGDLPGECRVARSMNGFKSMETIGHGDESWRTVSVQFTAHAVYYGSDAEFRQNHLYRLARNSGRETLTEVDGPVYYSAARNRDLFFGVTAELCPSQTRPVASLWHVDPQDSCSVVADFAKDRLPIKLFQPGIIQFPGGRGQEDLLHFNGVGLRGLADATLALHRVSIAEGATCD